MAFKRRRLSLVYLALMATVIGCATLIRFPDAEETVRFVPYNPRSDLKFSHDIHQDDCFACHPGLSEDVEEMEEVKDPSSLKIPAKDRCFECHARGEKCSFCHESRRVKVMPPNHGSGFMRNHRDEALAAAARCDWCHGQGAERCDGCHRRLMPLDHTPRWANTLHGRASVNDRKRCWVCHQSVSCARCHSQRPETHTASFVQGAHGTIARRKLRSCYVCHTYGSTCARCHN